MTVRLEAVGRNAHSLNLAPTGVPLRPWGILPPMPSGYFITHPDVIIDPAKPIERWALSPRGRERMRALLGQPWLRQVGCVLSSSEQKAIDGAEILLSAIAVPHRVVSELGEFDRSSTGLLLPDEFLSLVDEFFRWPERSIRGWEPQERQGIGAPVDRLDVAIECDHG
jgi:broad specificity phosphatase PhoE